MTEAQAELIIELLRGMSETLDSMDGHLHQIKFDMPSSTVRDLDNVYDKLEDIQKAVGEVESAVISYS